MSFFDELAYFRKSFPFHNRPVPTEMDIRRILRKEALDIRDFASLISPEASPYLELMAQEAHRRTVAQFGKTVLLYTPLYLSNFCVNQCVYCGFRHSNEMTRKKLSDDEIRQEATLIATTGLKHILILTGESPEESPVEYITRSICLLREYFQSISIEIYPLTKEEYAQCIQAGADGLTLYQEVYCAEEYAKLHLRGPKRDFHFRLEAPERAASAGIRTITLGPLLGLSEWRTEAILCAFHAFYLQDRFLSCEIGVSFPRLRPECGGFEAPSTVPDRDYVQLLCAFRLLMPRSGITVSTRESAAFRDNLLPLGVTKMSAGSSTAVGGRTGSHDEGQFDISDHRSVREMQEALAARGYQATLKDWHFFEVKS